MRDMIVDVSTTRAAVTEGSLPGVTNPGGNAQIILNGKSCGCTGYCCEGSVADVVAQPSAVLRSTHALRAQDPE